MSDDQPPWPRWFDDRPPPGTVEWTPTPAAQPAPAEPPPPHSPALRRDLDTATVRLRPARRPRCLECGGAVAGDGYCQTCGAKVPTPREHYEAAPAAWLAGVSDRGVTHVRNEDALALWAAPDPYLRAVLVVCDGVSTAEQSDVAALAAAERARDVLAGRGDAPAEADPEAALVAAVAAANAAVIEHTDAGTTNAPACTIAAALVDGSMVHVANVGDSRVYWIGATQRVILSTDHSLAGDRVAAGESRAVAEHAPGAHAITRWLGLDAENPHPTVARFTVTEDGWLVVCSDGLWNYASEPAALAGVLADAAAGTSDPLAVARHLVDWANAQGGKDNVTVGLAYLRANLQIRSASPATKGK